MRLVAYSLLAGVFGLAVGSFLNVVIHRVPAGVSVVRPPSACPQCGHEIRNRHNVPVLGWLVLRGRCYDCQEPISPRYPLIEAATGALFAGVTAALLCGGRPWLVPVGLFLVAVCVVAAMLAADRQPFPPNLIGPSFAVQFGLLMLAATFEPNWWGLGRAVIATTGCAIAGLLLGRGGGSGSADAREFAQLAAAPIAFFSWWAFVCAVAIAAVLAMSSALIATFVPSR